MIICICRRIKESDFETKEELFKRIMDTDINCGQCQEFIELLKQTNEDNNFIA